MAFAARRLPDDSILIVTFNVPIEQHLKCLQSLNAEIDGFARTMVAQTCGLILDMRALDLTCSDFAIWIEEYRSGAFAFLDHPFLRVFAVGTHPVLSVGLKKIERQLNISIALYDTIAVTISAAQRAISTPDRT
jgi:hypothetical protein